MAPTRRQSFAERRSPFPTCAPSRVIDPWPAQTGTTRWVNAAEVEHLTLIDPCIRIAHQIAISVRAAVHPLRGERLAEVFPVEALHLAGGVHKSADSHRPHRDSRE